MAFGKSHLHNFKLQIDISYFISSCNASEYPESKTYRKHKVAAFWCRFFLGGQADWQVLS